MNLLAIVMSRVVSQLAGILIFVIYCQPLAGQVLNLEGAVHAAIENYPTLAARQEALEATRSNAQVIRDSRLPNVRLHDQVNLGTANGLSGSYFSMGLIVPTSGGRRPDNSLELATGNIALATADWEVYNFGRFKAEDRLAQVDISVGEAAVATEKFKIRQSVITTYLDLIWLHQTLKIEERNLGRVDTARRVISNLVHNGIRPGLDSSLVAVELSRARLNYFQLREEQQKALIQLATLTGRSVTDLQIDTTFNERLLYGPLIPGELATDHPLLHYRQALIERASGEIETIRKSAMPRISLLTSVWARGTSLDIDNNFGSLGKGLGYSRSNFLLGVAATVNLTDFRRVRSRLIQQQWRIKESASLLTTEKIQLQNVLTTSDSVLVMIRAGLRELPFALNAAELAYQQRLSLYNNGIENILALTESLQLLTAVERQSVGVRKRAVNVWLQRAYATDDFDDFYALFRHK